MDTSTSLMAGLLILATFTVGIIALFFICRAIVLWYFRINQIADDLHFIAERYRKMDAMAEDQRVEEARKEARALRATRPALAE